MSNCNNCVHKNDGCFCPSDKNCTAYEKDVRTTLPPINPPTEQVSTQFNLTGDKSHALPFSTSGLSYDYWGP